MSRWWGLFALLFAACSADDLAELGYIAPAGYDGCPQSAPPVPTCDTAPELCDLPAEFVRPLDATRAFVIVFVPEGYRESELDGFRKHVDQLVDGLRSDPHGLVGRNPDHYDFRRLEVASSTTELLDADRTNTAFGGCLSPSGALLTVDAPRVRLAVDARTGARPQVANADAVVAIFNTPYGRPNADLASGQKDNIVRITRDSSVHTLEHELGHALIGLGDEYTETSRCLTVDRPAFRTRPWDLTAPNLTLDRDGAKWSSIIDGAEEGGEGYSCGIFHPTTACRMNQNDSDFCPVCSAEIDRRLADVDGSAQDGPPSCDISLSQTPGHISGHVWGSVTATDRNRVRVRVFLGGHELDQQNDLQMGWSALFPFELDTADAGTNLMLRAVCTDSLGLDTERNLDLSKPR